MNDTNKAPAVYPLSRVSLPTRSLREGRYEVGFVRSAEELDEVLRLRFEVFNLELKEGLDASYKTGRDEDPFDAVCHHLVVRDTGSDEVVGCYRLQTSAMASEHRGFYSDAEYDLSQLPKQVLDSAVEVGRACIARAHRSTQVLFLLWKGLALYVASNQLRYVFGCSSLTSQDPGQGWSLMAYLEREGHLHPDFHLDTRPEYECPAMDVAPTPMTRRDLPALFRIYLRHGAKVCTEPAIDRRFKTIDFLVLFDVDAMPRRMFRVFFG